VIEQARDRGGVSVRAVDVLERVRAMEARAAVAAIAGLAIGGRLAIERRRDLLAGQRRAGGRRGPARVEQAGAVHDRGPDAEPDEVCEADPRRARHASRYHRRVRSAVILLAAAACGRPAAPSPPLDHGAPAAEGSAALLALRDANDTSAIRAHAWRQWQALTRGSVPAMERWLRSDVVFSQAPLVASRELAFRPPRPLLQHGVALAVAPQLYDVLLDGDAAEFVRVHGLQRRDAVAASTSGHIPEMPVGAAAIKRVWVAIHAHGLTAVPVWDDTPAHPDAAGNAPETWTRVVAVDPSRATIPDGETADVTFHGHTMHARVVSLARFYHRPIATDGELRTARVVIGDDVVRGDAAALVAVHLTTKEIPDWTWSTWWWHDAPDDGAFGAGRPAALTGWAASYRMDATLSADAPMMNPWLEARFPGGLASACGSCHQRAALGANEFLPVPTALTPAGDPYFTGKVTTDFLWSIAFEAK
jgi:hypothetical protein